MATQEFRRKLTAILSADVEGYSLLMRDDEEATIRTLTTYRKAMTHLILQYRGRVVDAPGDNLLAEFISVVDTVNCAAEIQRDLAERNAELPEDRRMQFRIGINLGDVVEKGERIYGDGVNIAARMEGLAEGGGICISGKVHEEVKNKLGLEYEYLGKQEVKNIMEPVEAYRVLSYPGATDTTIRVTCEMEAGDLEHIEMETPCVIGAGKDLNQPSYPKLPDILKARKKPLTEIELSDLGIATPASRVEMINIESVKEERYPETIDGTADEIADTIVHVLREKAKVLEG